MDFFVSPFASFATESTTWVVTRRDVTPGNAVAVCDTREDAVARAIEMARYQLAIGQSSRVLQRLVPSDDWEVVWPQEGPPPRRP